LILEYIYDRLINRIKGGVKDMNFLDKLYESNYFGIGLFAVISFLVITFLVVLFFGKKDEKKRKLEETNKVMSTTNSQDLFKETSEVTPITIPVNPEPVNSVMPTVPVGEIPSVPIQEEQTPIMPTVTPIPVQPMPSMNGYEPIKPVAPINYEEPKNNVENRRIDEPVSPIINEPVTPIIPEPIRNVEPIKLEPTKYDIPNEPKVMEPIKITIPEEPVKVEPLIKEEESPIVTPVINEPAPKIVEPVITDSYYKPVEKVESEEIQVPNIDFDALAKSISQELDELEKNSSNAHNEEVKVTPMSEVVPKPTNQFSSVYVTEPVRQPSPTPVDLPKTIDLPTKKNEEIKPESYNI